MKNRQDWIEELLSDAEWHTQQAEKLRAAAELLQEDHPQVATLPERNGLTRDSVVKAMGGKGKKVRKANLVKMLGVKLEELDAIMTPENGFVVGDYGWWVWNG